MLSALGLAPPHDSRLGTPATLQLALLRGPFALVCQPLALVRDPLALVRDVLAFRRNSLAFANHPNELVRLVRRA